MVEWLLMKSLLSDREVRCGQCQDPVSVDGESLAGRIVREELPASEAVVE